MATQATVSTGVQHLLLSQSKKTTILSQRSILRHDRIRLPLNNGTFLVRSSQSDNSDVNTAQPSNEVKKTVIRRRKKEATLQPEDIEQLLPNDDLSVRKVEDSRVSVEGVAKFDRDDDESQNPPVLNIIATAAGDLFFLLLFAWIGRATHVSTAIDFELLKTADPFIAGWVIAAYSLGDYLPDRPKPKGVGPSAVSGAKTWALGVPLGIAIRSFGKGQLPALPFVGVTLASTFVFLVGWRAASAALLGGKDDEKKQQKYGNRRGNPFEFLELLTSLVRRW